MICIIHVMYLVNKLSLSLSLSLSLHSFIYSFTYYKNGHNKHVCTITTEQSRADNLLYSGSSLSTEPVTRMRVIAASSSAKVGKHQDNIFDTWFSEQHADGTNRLAWYDFLLMFCNHRRSRWNPCQVSYKPLYS